MRAHLVTDSHGRPTAVTVRFEMGDAQRAADFDQTTLEMVGAAVRLAFADQSDDDRPEDYGVHA